MFITTLIPIARGIPFDTLSYYVSEDLGAGTLVTVPFGKQTIHGLVTETLPLAQAKGMIKSASFTLKKVTSVIGTTPLLASLARALIETSTLTVTPIGALAGNVFPQTFFEYINSEKIVAEKTTQEHSGTFSETALAGTLAERMDNYKRIIRSSFAAKKSVVFVAPTIRSLERYKTLLEKGIGSHCTILHSKITKKQLRSTFALLKSSDRPLVLFTTTAFLSAARPDTGIIIAEDESQQLYHSNDRYKTDLRIFIAQFARELEIPLHWGDTLPRFATLKRTDTDHLPRTFIPEKLTVVPIEHYKTVLPSEVIDVIRHGQKKGRRIYIYANRKGVAPLSRCSDCGTLVDCENCHLPMVLKHTIQGDGGRVRTFICTHCAHTLPTTHTCSYCGSWNINPLAIGTESIHDAVRDIVGDEHVVVIDDDITPDSTEIEKIISATAKSKFVVIVGTIKAFPYLTNIHYALFPFFDRMLSTPSIYTSEQVLRTLMQCNEQVSERVAIFTRDPSFPLINQLETQKINAYIHDELLLRSELGYPPFGTLIKISITVPEGYRVRTMEQVNEYLAQNEVNQMPARRISQTSMKVLLVWIIKAQTNYIEEEGQALVHFLQSLRFPYMVEENPERL